jgi:hypothetical protein
MLRDNDGDAVPDILVIDATDTMPAGSIAQAAGRADQLVVRASVGTLDDVIATWPQAETVIGQDFVELHFAVASALKRAETGVDRAWDVATDEGLRLQRLADEIARIARTLVDLPEGLNASALKPRAGDSDSVLDMPATDTDTLVTAAEVRGIIRLRRLRDRYFPAELFADPAWDMLLDLAAARIERVSVAVSSLCIAAAVPPTTALRWIKAMTERGLLRRVADEHDARRIFIRLSDDAAKMMDQYLRSARAVAAQPI